MNCTTRRRSWAPFRIVSVYSYSISVPRSHVWHTQKLSLILRNIVPLPSRHAHSLRGLSNEDVLPEKGVMSRSLPRWVLRSGGLLTSIRIRLCPHRCFRGLVSWCLGRHRSWSYLVRSLLCVMCRVSPLPAYYQIR